MADLTWYSREGADQRFLTRIEAGNLASKLDVTQGDAALGEMCIRDSYRHLPQREVPDRGVHRRVPAH